MTLKPLDPRFGKLIALMRSSTHEGEREAARNKAAAIAEASGSSFDRALAQLNYEAVRAANPNNFLAGFDEYEEISNPGHLARLAAKKAEKQRIWTARRAAVLERYGSVDAAVAPCPRETLLRAALKPWRVVHKKPYQRWTSELKGWSYISLVEKMPADLRAAIEGAYPMPTSFDEACAEFTYWQTRDEDMRHALSENGSDLGDYALDRVAMARMEIIRDLVDHGMQLTTLPEIVERFRVLREAECTNEEMKRRSFGTCRRWPWRKPAKASGHEQRAVLAPGTR